MLTAPESIRFENITTLTVKQNERQQPGLRQGPVSITLDRIRFLRLDTGSFSQWNESSLDISITNIGSECIIYGGAVKSSSFLTNVTVENITDGKFYPGTFATTLGRLTLRNVTMALPCQNNTFAGSIRKLSLTSVTLESVNEGCFLAREGWGSLEVRSSHLGEISARGLQGRIADVLIEQSNFGRILPNGFDLDVTSLLINASRIQMLAKHALNLRASEGLTTQKSNVIELQRNAFHHLRSSKPTRGITLSQLAIDRVSNGSLRVHDVNSLTLRRLQIHISCGCRIQEQVGQLFSLEMSPRTLSGREVRLFVQHATRNLLCLHNIATPSLWEYYCSNCHPSPKICSIANGKAVTNQTSPDFALPSWVPVVVSSLCLLLLCGAIMLFVILHRLHSASRRSTSRAKRPPVQRVAAADMQFPLQEIDSRHVDSPPRLPGGDPPQTDAESTWVDRDMYASVADAMVPLDIYEEVSGAGGGEDLYEEIPLLEPTGEVEAPAGSETSQVQPLYAEVNKSKGKASTCSTSEAFVWSADSSVPPVYAKVNKTKIRAGPLPGEDTYPAENTGQIPSDAVSMATEQGFTKDAVSDLPVYAQVIKKRRSGKKQQDVHYPVKHPDTSETDAEADMTSELPVYAQVNKHTSDGKKSKQPGDRPEQEPAPEHSVYAQTKNRSSAGPSQANRPDPSDQTWQFSDDPLYEEVPGLAPAEDGSRGRSSQGCCPAASGLCDSAVPSRPQPTEGSAATPPLGSDQERSSLHAEVMYSPVVPSDAGGRHSFDEGLQDNALYGTIESKD